MKKVFSRVMMLVVMLALTVSLSGCIKKYNTPEFVVIEPSQTAFVVPLVGDTNDQLKFDSEELLNELKVASKEIQITKRWVSTGRLPSAGEWRPSVRIIIVERKPETREWTADTDTGTEAVNQGITAESKESITFSVSVNVSAQIDEENAAKFLYRYNNKSLFLIMDDEIRARIESKFVEEPAEREMTEILAQKKDIMDAVREDVISYFAERGITITVIGLKGDVQYADPAIQDAINLEFIRVKEQEAKAIQNITDEARQETEKTIAETLAAQVAAIAQIEAQKLVDVATKETEEQAIRNQTAIDMAVAEATVIETIANANREELRQAVLAFSSSIDPITGDYVVTEAAVLAYVQLAYYSAWDGSVPQTILDAVLSTLAVTDPSEE